VAAAVTRLHGCAAYCDPLQSKDATHLNINITSIGCLLCPQPVLTTSLAAVFLGQTLTGRDLAAVGAILAGVLCVIYSKVSEDSRRCGRQV
jgi:threonine/homoserine efflux transporter RhtA